MTAIYPSQTTWPAPGHSLNIRIFTPGVLLYLFLLTFCFIITHTIHILVSVLSVVFVFVHLSFQYALYHSCFYFCFICYNRFLFTFCFIMRYIIHISVSVLFHVFHSVYLSFPQYKYRYVLTLKSYNNGYTRSVYKCKWSFK